MIYEILGSIILTLLGIIGWFTRNKILSLDSKVNENAEKMHQVELNYLDRFADVKDVLNGNHNETMKAINQIKITCAAFNHTIIDKVQ